MHVQVNNSFTEDTGKQFQNLVNITGKGQAITWQCELGKVKAKAWNKNKICNWEDYGNTTA